MARIIAIDYGKKRCGIAVTDPLQIIATALDTVHPESLLDYLKNYSNRESIERFIIGLPLRFDGTTSEIENDILHFIEVLKNDFPNTPISRIDESFTSQKASKTLVDAGYKKKKRQEKGNIDKISAVLILQEFMNSQL